MIATPAYLAAIDSSTNAGIELARGAHGDDAGMSTSDRVTVALALTIALAGVPIVPAAALPLMIRDERLSETTKTFDRDLIRHATRMSLSAARRLSLAALEKAVSARRALAHDPIAFVDLG